jgi:hypothetical protein
LFKISSTKSSRATKITIKMFEQAVTECVNAVHIDTSSPQTCMRSLSEKKRDLVKKVQLRLNAVPKKTSTKIGFSALQEKAEPEPEPSAEADDAEAPEA